MEGFFNDFIGIKTSGEANESSKVRTTLGGPGAYAPLKNF